MEDFIRTNDNVSGIYIALEKESSMVNTFAKKLDLKTPILMDKFETFAKKHGVILEDGQASLPKTFLVDEEGYVIAIITLEGGDFDETLRDYLP